MEGGVLEPLGINDEAATEIAIITAVLRDSPNAPVTRWFEYRAYQELVLLLRNADQLPAGYKAFIPEASSLLDWLLKGKDLERPFSTEIARLIAGLKAIGSGTIDNICNIYCAAKGKTGMAIIDGLPVAIRIAIAAGLAGAMASGPLALLLASPYLLAWLLRAGTLDKFCDCPAKPLQARERGAGSRGHQE